MILSLLLGFVLGAGALLFVIQNTTVVALTFLGWQFESSIALLVLLAMLVGVIFTLLMSLPGAIANSFKLRALTKNNQALAKEAELHKQAADTAKSELLSVQTPRPDVVDLTR